MLSDTATAATTRVTRTNRVTGQATALAHGAVLLGGWLWLGLQGMRLGWSLGGGLGVVALWWALHLLCRHWAPAVKRGSAAPWLLGAATAMGVLLIERAGLGGLGLPVLLGTAVAWALWCHTLETGGRGARLPSTRARLAQDGGTATAMTGSPSSPASTALRALLQAPQPAAMTGSRSSPMPTAGPGSRSTATTLWTATVPALAAHALPATAMGLMMGTLWLSSQWCATAGWPPHTLVAVHAAFMLLLPPLLQRPRAALQHQSAWRHGLPLALLALGGLVLAASATAPGWMAGMALQALAWALAPAATTRTAGTPASCALNKAFAENARLPQRPLQHRPAALNAQPQASMADRLLAFCLVLGGPLLLWWVGLLSPTTGPDALHGALALLGALALAALLPGLWHSARRTLRFYLPSTPSADAP